MRNVSECIYYVPQAGGSYFSLVQASLASVKQRQCSWQAYFHAKHRLFHREELNGRRCYEWVFMLGENQV